MDTINDRPAVLIATVDDVHLMDEIAEEKRYEELEAEEELFHTSIASHIMEVFQENKDARETSGIEEKMLQSLRAYNGHYDPEDMARILESTGSSIFMNLTATKCRAAMSWIRDILMPAKENAWSLSPTPDPKVPENIRAELEEKFAKIEQEMQGEPQAPQAPQAQEGQAPKQGPQQVAKAATSASEQRQMKRDIEEALVAEVYKQAENEVKYFETLVADNLAEGCWLEALSQVIEDFCVFPVAIMKGPIITRKGRLSYDKGMAIPVEEYVYLNKRVSPLDMYPSASATSIQDGPLCEHVRFTRGELYDLIGVEGYKEEAIREVLEQNKMGSSVAWISSSIEDERVVEEYRGDTYRANKGVIHGIHFFGTCPASVLEEWGMPLEEIGYDPEREVEVEAILAGNEVIKCVVNDDPLMRRPYYKASFQNIPGSWWGRSLPELMRDIQRMCNATARALSNNMAIASGPQVEIYTDRLAADEEIEELYPWKIWQLTSDPTGAGGRAVTFWQPTSNASELLAVYKEFELRADDATGIPRYAYGNDRNGGAAQTASGLSMLLESASKGIKDAIRHLDDGIIKPRVEYQFYWEVLTSDREFTGDVQVIPKGSQALTMRGAIEMRRNEFLQILANPTYLQIVGVEGVAEILREMSNTLGLGENIVPSRIELKKKFEEMQQQEAQKQQQEAQAKQQQAAVGVQQVQMQTQQAEQASQRSAQLKAAEIEQKERIEQLKAQLKAAELELRREESVSKNTAALQKQQMSDAQKDRDTNKNIALSIQSGYQDKNNAQ